ncbi:IMPG2 protein, partial [Urocolius indicus]|nr:IMPG2 protein [Urocolius indicus]
LPGTAGGQDSDSHPSRGMDFAWQGPYPTLPSLKAGGHGEMGTTSLPAPDKVSDLPIPTAMVSLPGETSPSPGGALDPAMGVGEPLNTESPPERNHVPLDQTWHPPAVSGQPLASVAPVSTAAAQSRVPYTSPGSPSIPLSPQPAPTSGSAGSMSPTLQPFLGTSHGVPGPSPTTGTPVARLFPDTGEDPAESPQILRGTLVGASNAPGHPQQPATPHPVSSLGPTTAVGITNTAVPATTTTASPALLGEDTGMVTPEPGAVGSQEDAAGLTGGHPTHLPTTVPGLPQQSTDPPGTLGPREDSVFPPAAGDTEPVQPLSSPGGWTDADTHQVTPAPDVAGKAPRVFIVEDQPPLLRASVLRIPCELVLDMGFVPALQDPGSRERQELLHSFNQTVTPLFMSVPGFLRLEVTGIRYGSVVLEYDALFAAERVQAPGLRALLDAALGSSGTRPGLAVGTALVLRNVALERPLDPCAVLFACRAGFACEPRADGNATCTSLCHRGYCKNHGICTHPRDREPLCQCPVGSDFWFMGLRCDYRVTQQSLLGMAAGVLLSIVLLGAIVAAVAIHRFKMLLLEARADQTRSSYRRFCRLDDVSAQYWSCSRLPSVSSLDNPAFSNSEELLHLQILDNGCCSCQDSLSLTNSAKRGPVPPTRLPSRPSFRYDWDTSSSSMNDPMVDSGKASDISVSSWPMEPIQWTPFPLLHQLSRQRPHRARRPHSYCEGMELVTLERSWTA